ncbi:MAG: hypothetical protein ACXVB0_04540 [Mucilaginibacter sp.]
MDHGIDGISSTDELLELIENDHAVYSADTPLKHDAFTMTNDKQNEI